MLYSSCHPHTLPLADVLSLGPHRTGLSPSFLGRFFEGSDHSSAVLIPPAGGSLIQPMNQQPYWSRKEVCVELLVTSVSLRTGLKSELKFGLKLKPRYIGRGCYHAVPVGASPGGSAGNGLATQKADIGVLAAVGRLVEEQVGVLADTVTTFTASVRLLIHVKCIGATADLNCLQTTCCNWGTYRFLTLPVCELWCLRSLDL